MSHDAASVIALPGYDSYLGITFSRCAHSVVGALQDSISPASKSITNVDSQAARPATNDTVCVSSTTSAELLNALVTGIPQPACIHHGMQIFSLISPDNFEVLTTSSDR